MRKRTIYPRPPIVEAVVEFNFAESFSQKVLLDALGPKLEGSYSGRKEQTRVDAAITVNAELVATETRKSTPVVFLTSADGLRLVGCANGALSVHVLAPYPGWESFFERVLEAVDSVPVALARAKLTQVAVRYIDRIVLPRGEVRLEDYLEVLPRRPALLPESLSAIHSVTQWLDSTDGTSALLTVAAIPPNSKEGSKEVVYDLLLQRGGELGTLAESGWRQVVDALHTRQREIFEDSITEKAKELFK